MVCWDMDSYLTEPSPARCPSVDGVENELPGFQRLDKYPTELAKDRDRCKESSLDSTPRGDGSFG